MTTVVNGHGYIYVKDLKTWVKVSCNCDITSKNCFRRAWINRGNLETGKRRKTTLSEELRLEEKLQSRKI